MVTSFNEFSRPEFCKIQIYSMKKYEVDQKEQEATRRIQMNSKRNNRRREASKNTSSVINKAIKAGIFPQQHANIITPQKLDFDQLLYSGKCEGPFAYERYMGRIKCKESPADIVSKDLFDQKHPMFKQQATSVFSRDSINKFIQVASPSEDFFRHHKNVILGVLREHLREVKRITEIYEQFQPLIRNTLRDRVTDFVSQPSSALEKMQEYSLFLKELRYY